MSVWSNESPMSQISLKKVAHMSPNFPNWFQNITGSQLLTMTKDEILDLTGMKVGPSLKIENLTTQLRMKVNPAQERMKAGLKKLLWAGDYTFWAIRCCVAERGILSKVRICQNLIFIGDRDGSIENLNYCS